MKEGIQLTQANEVEVEEEEMQDSSELFLHQCADEQELGKEPTEDRSVVVPLESKERKVKRFDWLGSILVALGTAGFLFFINQLPSYGWVLWPIGVSFSLFPSSI